MLTFENVSLTLGEFTLSADLSLNSQITALLGPSGSGKSTILNLIAGFANPDRGSVLWRGELINNMPPTQRPVAMLFQDNNLFPHLTVLQNLSLALTQKKPDQKQKAQIAQALDRVGLSSFEARKPASLSGGQQSRVALARVLLQARPLMLLDEPFAALGPSLKNEMLDLVLKVSNEEKMQVVMVSHDPHDAKRIAQEACVVAEGAITKPVGVKALLKNPPKALADYLG